MILSVITDSRCYHVPKSRLSSCQRASPMLLVLSCTGHLDRNALPLDLSSGGKSASRGLVLIRWTQSSHSLSNCRFFSTSANCFAVGKWACRTKIHCDMSAYCMICRQFSPNSRNSVTSNMLSGVTCMRGVTQHEQSAKILA